MKSLRWYSKSTLPAFLLLSTGVSAQEGMLEEVVVTAQKRSESLTDVPISIGVMSAEALAKTGVRQLREVAEFVPNLTISSGNDSSTAVERTHGTSASTPVWEFMSIASTWGNRWRRTSISWI